MINQRLERYSADAIALPDYALLFAGSRGIRKKLILSGASIDLAQTSQTYVKEDDSWLWLFKRRKYGAHPSVILQVEGTVLVLRGIQPDNTVGNCWAFKGSKGYVTIELAQPIIPTNFTLDHVPEAVAHNPLSAPKEFSVYVSFKKFDLI